MVVAVMYILYLLFLIVRACSELGHMPYVGECWSSTPGAGPPARSGWRAPSGRGEPRQGCRGDWATWTVPQARAGGAQKVSWGPGGPCVWLLELPGSFWNRTFWVRRRGWGFPSF